MNPKGIHDSRVCACEMCRFADEVEQRAEYEAWLDSLEPLTEADIEVLAEREEARAQEYAA